MHYSIICLIKFLGILYNKSVFAVTTFKQEHALKQNALSGQVCNAETTWLITAYSRLNCAVHCLADNNCNGVFFDTRTKDCKGNGRKQATDSCIGSTYMRFYSFVTCDNGYTLYPEGNFCYKFHHQCAKWQLARDTCIAEGGDLIQLYDYNTFLYFKGLAASQGPHDCDFGYWVGTTDAAVEGLWTWFDGTPVHISMWLAGEPTGLTGEDCAYMRQQYSYEFVDDPCDWDVAFVCAQQ